jgi:endonuclease YncB( thermonuclease family)
MIGLRPGEKIGGGFFVFRRGKRTGRVGISSTLPFEHPDLLSATREARRLAAATPGETFEVFATTNIAFTETPDAPDSIQPQAEAREETAA